MRAMTKKLLSALVVLAMVLSMVPVVGLPAITASAAVNAKVTAADALDFSGTLPTTCPACSATGVTWEPLPAAGATVGADTTKHYYLASDMTFDGATLLTVASSTSKLCLHLNGKTLTTSGKIYSNAGNSYIRIMGSTGTVNYTGTESFIQTIGNIYIYGGTYNTTTGNLMTAGKNNWNQKVYGTSTFNGPVIITQTGNNCKFCINDEASFTDLTVNGSAGAVIYTGWSGTISRISCDDARSVLSDAVLNIDGAITGNIYNEEGYRLIKGTGSAAIIDPTYTPSNPGGGEEEPETPTLPTTCPACSATNVTWEELPAAGATVGADTTKHYYLASDMTFDGATLLTVATSSSRLCLHLNGKTLNTSGNIYSNAGGSKIKVMGSTGTVNYTGTGSFIDTIGQVEIYGGTYNSTTGNLMHLKIASWGKKVYGTSTFNGPVIIENANTNTCFSIYDETNFTDLTVKGGAKAVIFEGWAGTISKFSCDANRSVLTSAVLNISGAFTGDIYDENGYKLIKGTGEAAVVDPNYTPPSAAKIGETGYATAQLAVNAAQAGEVVTLLANATIDITDKSVTVDAAGFNVTVTGEGTLKAIDTANDDYSGCGTWTISNVTNWVTEANGGKYVLIEGETAGTYTAHRLDIRVSAVNLRTTQAGLYYTAEYKCDADLAAKVKTYGVALSLTEIPTDLASSAYTAIETSSVALTPVEDATNTYTTNSGAVVNILTEGNAENAANAIKAVKANAYLDIDTGAEESVVVMGIADTDDGASYSLADVLDTINDGWNETWMIEAAKTLVAQFYKKWSTVFEAVTGYDFSAIAQKASEL